MATDGQCFRALDRVITFRQGHRYWRINLFVGDGQIDERAPSRFGKKAPEMHLYFGQGIERFKVDLLTARGIAV